MNENLRKTLLYFRKWDTYWKLTDKNQKTAIPPGTLGRYPLDFKPRIEEGHYPNFDKNGVPMWYNEAGGYLYHYTTMFSYALGQWDYYMLYGTKESLEAVLGVADYVLKSGVKDGRSFVLKESDKEGKHTGNISAMVQGEAMSVLTRAWQASRKDEYLETAKLCITPFTKKINENGIVGNITSVNVDWYEEYITTPLDHVLNGMVYSLWGLRDIWVAGESKLAKKLFEDGVESVTKALKLFDTGYWSYYWTSEGRQNYIASMMYHNLHICQLTDLYENTGNKVLKEYADKFKRYTFNPVNRLKAIKMISGAKLSGSTEG